MQRSYSPTVVIEGTLVTVTDKAIGLACNLDNRTKLIWIPKSLLRRSPVVLDVEEKSWNVFIPQWLADKHPTLGYDEYDSDDWEEDGEGIAMEDSHN